MPPGRNPDVAGRLDDPLAAALASVGDRWTLQVIDRLLAGPRRFGELLDGLPGLASNVLSTRLKALEADGLVLASPYQDRPLRLEYRLTAAGSELAGALRLLARWGADHAGDRDGALLHHDACGTSLEARWYCPTCDRVVDDPEASDVHEL
jgi:DNA-binding HxlR family transcriptional regulator